MVSITQRFREYWFPQKKTDRLSASFAESFGSSLQAAYDGYRTTPQTERYWAQADFLSPQSANLQGKRKVLRSRSRYECVESNSYARGMVLTKVADVIGKGPTLQIQDGNREFAKEVENEFVRWAKAINLPSKLRALSSAKIVDGEAFAEKITNRTLSTPVQLDLRLSEADLWANPLGETGEDPLEHDGIRFDRSGNPIRYTRLKYHPGDSHYHVGELEYDYLSPDDVLHWYRVDRPDQKRGIPEFTAALPLFAELRRWIMATLAAAETAAEFAAVLESTAARFSDNPDEIATQLSIPVNRRAIMSLPAGWTMKQFKAENPNSNFEQFEEKILMQIARCLQMPLNIAMGSSRNHNFASGRLDYLLWWNACDIERNDCEIVVLDRIFQWWLEEAKLVPGYLPPIGETLVHQWYWPERRPIDEVAHAKATESLWNMGLVSDEQVLKERSIDPADHYEQLRRAHEARKQIDEHYPVPGIAVSESVDNTPEEEAQLSE